MQPSDGMLRRLGGALLATFAVVTIADAAVQLQDPRHYSDWGAGGLGNVIFIGMITLFPVVAQLIVRQQPRNRIGWLLHGIGAGWTVTNLTDLYVGTTMVWRPGSLPQGEIAEVINSSTWVPPIVLMGVFVLLLFPDGKPPGPRWRLIGLVAALDGAVVMAGILIQPGPVPDVRVPLPENPLGIEAVEPFSSAVQGLSLLVIPLSIIAAAAAMIVKFRRAEGVQRLQLRWLMAAGSAIAVISSVALTAGFGSTGPAPGWQVALQSLDLASFGLIPVAIGIAVTRHGLYGLDALISRALTVTMLGAFITAVYVGIVVGIGTLIGQQRPSVALSVAATGLVAVAFQPVRERVQHLVNRLVYGERATPYEVLADFAVQMAGRYTTGELIPRLAQTLSQCLGGAQVSIWLRSRRGLSLEGAWPVDPGQERFLPASGTVLSPLERGRGVAADLVVPVRHRDELLGGIAVAKPAHEPLAPAEAGMLQHVASQAGLVLRNLRLVEDLQTSRRRLVSAQEDERRRLERDLHDGAQQSLVSVAIMLQVAAAQSEADARAEAVAIASAQLRTAIGELRELAHGIHPAVLTERGLVAAVRSLAERSAVPVTVGGNLDRRLAPALEATAYFVVAEGLTNIAKYAQAGTIAVEVQDTGLGLTVTITDDGVGGANLHNGSGLLGLTDRLAVVDGQLELHSPRGRGTRLSCTIPLPAGALAGA